MVMQDKKGLITGVANNKSIAYGIAKACTMQGVTLTFTFLNKTLKRRVEPIAAESNSGAVYEPDVNNKEHLDKVASLIRKDLGEIDFIVHAVASALKGALENFFLRTSKKAFDIAMRTSVHSLLSLTGAVLPTLKDSGSILTLSYLGGVGCVPHYSVVGVVKITLESSVRYLARGLGERRIRVNTISAGLIKTLATSGIGGFRTILRYNEINTPLERSVSIEDVGNSAMYLLDDLAKGVTGEIHYVDAGYNIMGMDDVTKDDEGRTILCWDKRNGQ